MIVGRVPQVILGFLAIVCFASVSSAERSVAASELRYCAAVAMQNIDGSVELHNFPVAYARGATTPSGLGDNQVVIDVTPVVSARAVCGSGQVFACSNGVTAQDHEGCAGCTECARCLNYFAGLPGTGGVNNPRSCNICMVAAPC